MRTRMGMETMKDNVCVMRVEETMPEKAVKMLQLMMWMVWTKVTIERSG
jgi:hypothetical protein